MYDFANIDAEKFPPYLMFDVVGMCNLNCVHCPQDQVTQRTYLDFDLFVRVIDEAVGNSIDFVRFTANGEPLLHPRIVDMIAYAKQNLSVPITLTSNGQLLDSEIAEALLDSKLDMIDISVDAFSKNIYEQIRLKGDYHQLMSNIHQLIYLRKRMRSEMRIVLSYVEQKTNQHETDAFQSYWTPLVDEVLIRPMHSMGGGVNVTLEWEMPKRYPCPHIWKRIVVDHTGRLGFCPVDMFSRALIGEFPEASVAEVWQGEAYKNLREAHLTNDFSAHTLCGECHDWASTSWHLGYGELVQRVMTEND